MELKFNESGKFKILQITDLHYKNDEEEDYKTDKLMREIIEKESPDFIVYTGDTIRGNICLEPEEKVWKAVLPAIENNIPFVSVFGNHDCEENYETKKILKKEDFIKIQKQSKLCMTELGDKDIDGVGNCYHVIKSTSKDKSPWVLFFFDSGITPINKNVNWEKYISRSQTDWFITEINKMKKELGEFNSLIFLHIPIPEFNDVWDFETCYGEKNERVCCPEPNSGFFSAMLEMENVRGVFAAHDHINDYQGKLYGIRLVYGRATGYNTYGKEGFERGARIIEVEENKDDFETYMRLESGIIVKTQKEHRPEGRKIRKG